MKIVLCDINEPLIEAWNEVFADWMIREDRQEDFEIQIIRDNIFNQPVDAIVSPANSFGFMDGGLDYLISKMVGWDVQDTLKNIIQAEFHGELLVGQAHVVKAKKSTARFPYVISAPTMRVPMILGPNSINVYLAAKALINACKEPNYPGEMRFNSIVVPGLGTGVGQVPVDVCAKQMRQGFEDALFSNFPGSWKEAQVRHQLLTTDLSNVKDLQKG